MAANDTQLLSVDATQPGPGSGVYVVERAPEKKKRSALLRPVTLFVYGWQNVQPGTMSWVFPSIGAAVKAAKAMTNAVKWAVVSGRRREATETEAEDALDDARANHAVLVEKAG